MIFTKEQIQEKVDKGINQFLELNASQDHESEIADYMRECFIPRANELVASGIVLWFLLSMQAYDKKCKEAGYPPQIAVITYDFIKSSLEELEGVKAAFDKVGN